MSTELGSGVGSVEHAGQRNEWDDLAIDAHGSPVGGAIDVSGGMDDRSHHRVQRQQGRDPASVHEQTLARRYHLRRRELDAES
jgi:hypothetical protein